MKAIVEVISTLKPFSIILQETNTIKKNIRRKEATSKSTLSGLKSNHSSNNICFPHPFIKYIPKIQELRRYLIKYRKRNVFRIGLSRKQILSPWNLKECLWKRVKKDLLKVQPYIRPKSKGSFIFLHKGHSQKLISCIIAKLEFQAKVWERFHLDKLSTIHSPWDRLFNTTNILLTELSEVLMTLNTIVVVDSSSYTLFHNKQINHFFFFVF